MSGDPPPKSAFVKAMQAHCRKFGKCRLGKRNVRFDQLRRGQSYNFLFLFLKHFTYLFLEKGERREKEGERNIDGREKHQ